MIINFPKCAKFVKCCQAVYKIMGISPEGGKTGKNVLIDPPKNCPCKFINLNYIIIVLFVFYFCF